MDRQQLRAQPFHVLAIHREDVLLALDDDVALEIELEDLADNIMRQIAGRLASAIVEHDFWELLGIVAQDTLAEHNLL